MEFTAKMIVYNGHKVVAKKMYEFMCENQMGIEKARRERAKISCDFVCDLLAASCDTNRIHQSHQQYRKVQYWHNVKKEIEKLHEKN